MMMFGSGSLTPQAGRGAAFGSDPPATEQLIAAGWGYASISPGAFRRTTARADEGIIGLVNKGQPRKPDDWGALRVGRVHRAVSTT
jgi:hypothetical protein